jgi:hypothetical protein
MMLAKPLYPFSKLIIFTNGRDEENDPIWNAVFRIAKMYNLSGTLTFVNDWSSKPIILGGDYLYALQQAVHLTYIAPTWTGLEQVMKGGGKRNKLADLFLSFDTDDELKRVEAQIEDSSSDLAIECRVFLISREKGSRILPTLKVAKRKFTFTETGNFKCERYETSKDWIGGVITSNAIQAGTSFQLFYAAIRFVGVYGVRVFKPEEAFLEYPDCVSAALSNILVSGVYFHHRRQGGYLVTREYQVAVESIGTVEPKTGDAFTDITPHWLNYMQTLAHDCEKQGDKIFTNVEGVIFRIICIINPPVEHGGAAVVIGKKRIRSRPVEAKGVNIKWW